MMQQRDLYERIEIAITRIPIFIFGCYIGKKVYEKKRISWHWLWIIILVAIAQFVILNADILHGIWRRYFYFIGGVSLTFLIPAVLDRLQCKGLNKILSFFGTISLELYLTHILVIRLYQQTAWYDEKRILHYLLIMVLSVLIAYTAEKIINKIKNLPNMIRNNITYGKVKE